MGCIRGPTRPNEDWQGNPLGPLLGIQSMDFRAQARFLPRLERRQRPAGLFRHHASARVDHLGFVSTTSMRSTATGKAKGWVLTHKPEANWRERESAGKAAPAACRKCGACRFRQTRHLVQHGEPPVIAQIGADHQLPARCKLCYPGAKHPCRSANRHLCNDWLERKAAGLIAPGAGTSKLPR
jgi:hypothetical protein